MAAMGVAMVGAGARSIAFARYLADHPDTARLVAVVDLNLEKAKFLCEHFKIDADVSDDLEAVLARDDVQAVLITTPDYAHVAPATAAMAAGCHVYMEKPLATTLEDCDAIIAAASQD